MATTVDELPSPPSTPHLVAVSPNTGSVASRQTKVEQLFETLVEAAFDLLLELGPLGLCLYLHAPHDEQPRLFIRSPRLQGLGPSDTFRLMHTITMLSNSRKPSAAFRHGDVDGHYVRSMGEASDGLFVFGGIQETDTARRMGAITRAFAHVLHQFHLDEDPNSVNRNAPHVSLDTLGGRTSARVIVRNTDGDLRGEGEATDTTEAVVNAVIAAVDPSFHFDEVRTLDLGHRSAVLAILRDGREQLRLGMAISGGDLIRTTALAAQRALQFHYAPA
jgi:hypothetical protein